MLSGNPTNANCDGSFQEDSFKKPRHYHIIISTINKDKKQCPKIWLRARKTFLSHFIKTYQAIKWMELHIPPLCVCVQFSLPVVSNSLRPYELQHSRPLCPSPTPRVHPNPCPLSRWCHPTTSSSVVSFSSCPPSFPASGSFQMSQLFTWGGQSIGVSASTSVLSMNTQDWSPLGWTGCISLQSKGLSRVFSNTTVQKHQFFGAQLSL